MIPAIALRYLPHALAVGAALAVAGWAYSSIWDKGYARCEAQHTAKMVEHLQRGLEQAQAIARQDAEVSEYYERERVRIETQIITVRDEVAHEVPADCRTCALNPLGLQRLNAALRGLRTPAADPEQPDGGVPGATAPPRWQLPGSLRPLGDGRTHVLKLRGEAQPADPRTAQP